MYICEYVNNIQEMHFKKMYYLCFANLLFQLMLY